MVSFGVVQHRAVAHLRISSTVRCDSLVDHELSFLPESRGHGMSRDEPLVRLPSSIELTLGEAGEVLFALDDAKRHLAEYTETAIAVRAAIRLVIRKIWPELGELLDEDEED